MKKTFVLLKMLSGFWNSAAVWSVCLRASGFVRVLWGVLLHRALFWMDLSQHVVWNHFYVWLWSLFCRCFWYGRHIGNLFCLSISLSLPVFRAAFFFGLPLSHLRVISLFLSVSPTHVFLFFSRSFTLFCTLFPFPLSDSSFPLLSW